MFQHIFWFFGHPEVYIMILPGFGIISHIVPAFSRKPLFGYASMVYATAAIAIVSVIVWAHHMFTTGMPVTAQLFFMYATMWRGAITLEAPMLFAIGFIWVFTIGDFSGLLLSVVPCWTRVAPPSGRRPLTGLEACGIRVEVGSFIGEKARRRVALELRQQLRIAAMPA